MSVNLLTRNQERRLTTHLRLLLEDLDALMMVPDLHRAGASGERLRRLLAEARAAAQDLRAALHLPDDHPIPPARRIAATAEVWAVRVEDLRSRRLRAYGEVHPGLSSALDPRLDVLRRALLSVAEAAVGLPETGE